VILPCGDGPGEPSQTCTVITTLLDHEAAPADQVRDTCLTRWSASETTFGEDKATITGAGCRTSGPVLRSGSPRLVIQEAWAWLTATQLVRASAAAALRSEALAAAAEAAARAALRALNIPGRQRHSERAQKARPKFRHTTTTKPTVTGKPQVTVFAPGFP
jgi:Flp pilus assembly protein TadG